MWRRRSCNTHTHTHTHLHHLHQYSVSVSLCLYVDDSHVWWRGRPAGHDSEHNDPTPPGRNWKHTVSVRVCEDRTQCVFIIECVCVCVCERRTRGASRRSAGCFRTQSCLFLSCPLESLWPPAGTWSPETHTGTRLHFSGTCSLTSISIFCYFVLLLHYTSGQWNVIIWVSPLRSLPDPSRSPSLIGSSRSPQTCKHNSSLGLVLNVLTDCHSVVMEVQSYMRPRSALFRCSVSDSLEPWSESRAWRDTETKSVYSCSNITGSTVQPNKHHWDQQTPCFYSKTERSSCKTFAELTRRSK